MQYHKLRFGFLGNLKVLTCRIFGHRLNNSPELLSCGRCGLLYEECYYPENYYVKAGFVQDDAIGGEIET